MCTRGGSSTRSETWRSRRLIDTGPSWVLRPAAATRRPRLRTSIDRFEAAGSRTRRSRSPCVGRCLRRWRPRRVRTFRTSASETDLDGHPIEGVPERLLGRGTFSPEQGHAPLVVLRDKLFVVLHDLDTRVPHLYRHDVAALVEPDAGFPKGLGVLGAEIVNRTATPTSLHFGFRLGSPNLTTTVYSRLDVNAEVLEDVWIFEEQRARIRDGRGPKDTPHAGTRRAEKAMHAPFRDLYAVPLQALVVPDPPEVVLAAAGCAASRASATLRRCRHCKSARDAPPLASASSRRSPPP